MRCTRRRRWARGSSSSPSPCPGGTGSRDGTVHLRDATAVRAQPAPRAARHDAGRAARRLPAPHRRPVRLSCNTSTASRPSRSAIQQMYRTAPELRRIYGEGDVGIDHLAAGGRTWAATTAQPAEPRPGLCVCGRCSLLAERQGWPSSARLPVGVGRLSRRAGLRDHARRALPDRAPDDRIARVGPEHRRRPAGRRITLVCTLQQCKGLVSLIGGCRGAGRQRFGRPHHEPPSPTAIAATVTVLALVALTARQLLALRPGNPPLPRWPAATTVLLTLAFVRHHGGSPRDSYDQRRPDAATMDEPCRTPQAEREEQPRREPRRHRPGAGRHDDRPSGVHRPAGEPDVPAPPPHRANTRRSRLRRVSPLRTDVSRHQPAATPAAGSAGSDRRRRARPTAPAARGSARSRGAAGHHSTCRLMAACSSRGRRRSGWSRCRRDCGSRRQPGRGFHDRAEQRGRPDRIGVRAATQRRLGHRQDELERAAREGDRTTRTERARQLPAGNGAAHIARRQRHVRRRGTAYPSARARHRRPAAGTARARRRAATSALRPRRRPCPDAPCRRSR